MLIRYGYFSLSFSCLSIFFSCRILLSNCWIFNRVGRLNLSDKTFFLWLNKYTRCGHLKWSNAQNWLINVTMSLLTDHVSGHTISKQCEHMQAHCCTISRRERNENCIKKRRKKKIKSTTNSNSKSNNNNINWITQSTKSTKSTKWY